MMMTDKYWIERFKIIDLWGYRQIALSFFSDVNILIGPNASGKTTILNLLRYVLTADLVSLNEMDFSSLEIRLKAFESGSRRTIKVRSTDKGFHIQVSRKTFEIDLSEIRRPFPRTTSYSSVRIEKRYRAAIRNIAQDLYEEIDGLVPAVWLPVSRRLPIAEEEDGLETDRRRFIRLESVDVRLRALLGELVHYRLGLDAQLSDRYKDFERRVLQMILYSKEYDQISSLDISIIPSEVEKEELMRAFEVADLLDTQMKNRIEEHFTVSEEAIERIKLWQEDEAIGINIEDFFIIPLIGRTESIVKFARELDQFREELFTPLRDYERIVSNFLHAKNIRVKENGELTILSETLNQEIGIEKLSSGEKQILILLTQAVLWEDKPIVYIADEPELSLHVKWQEKLLSSLTELGDQIQIIVATHSPDIVGPYLEKVIELSVGDVKV